MAVEGGAPLGTCCSACTPLGATAHCWHPQELLPPRSCPLLGAAKASGPDGAQRPAPVSAWRLRGAFPVPERPPQQRSLTCRALWAACPLALLPPHFLGIFPGGPLLQAAVSGSVSREPSLRQWLGPYHALPPPSCDRRPSSVMGRGLLPLHCALGGI